jgi:hypothetical protein
MPKDKGRRSPLQDLKKRHDAAKSDEQRIALLETAKPAELQALVAAMSLETQIQFIAQASAERLALFRAKGIKFDKLLNAQPEELKSTIEVILAPLPLGDQIEFMRKDKNPEWAAFLKTKGISINYIPGEAVVIVGGDTKYHSGRRWGKGEWIQEAFRVLLGKPRDEHPNMTFLTDDVENYLAAHTKYKSVSYRQVCRKYKDRCEAHKSPRPPKSE